MPNEFVPDEHQLAEMGRHFADLTRLLGPDSTSPDPDRLVRLARAALPASDHCAVTLLRRGHAPRTVAATSEVASVVDAIQHELGEGPCLAAAGEYGATLSPDLVREERWPRFAQRCVAETGVHGVLALRLTVGGSDQAAINYFSDAPGRFQPFDVALGSLFAPYAALAVEAFVHEQDVAQYQEALSTSRQIGTAIGILMAREQLSATEAFAMLRTSSQHLNTKLRDIADEVVREAGAAPPGVEAGDRPKTAAAPDPGGGAPP